MICRLLGALATCVLAAVCLSAHAVPPAAPHGEVILTKLGPVLYPQIARTAHISGDVEVALEIKHDGTIESASAVSGPALLYRAAVESAQLSQFECHDCADALTTYHLHYTFRLVDPVREPCGAPDSCNRTFQAQVRPQIMLSNDHVTIIEGASIYCDCVFAPKPARSVKCLYLWHCVR
jgi:hypothetical protein